MGKCCRSRSRSGRATPPVFTRVRVIEKAFLPNAKDRCSLAPAGTEARRFLTREGPLRAEGVPSERTGYPRQLLLLFGGGRIFLLPGCPSALSSDAEGRRPPHQSSRGLQKVASAALVLATLESFGP